jgi:hypothetical protein
MIGEDPIQGSTTRIGKVSICLISQGRDHFSDGLETLREEFLCHVSRRLVNISLKWMLAAQRIYLATEDEIRESEGRENGEEEFGLRIVIPDSMTDAGEQRD